MIVKILKDGAARKSVGSYTYRVLINDDTVAQGAIKGYPRDAGWQGLISSVAAAIAVGNTTMNKEKNNGKAT